MRTSILSTALLVWAASITAAQDTLPNAVSRAITDDTIAVIQIDLKSYDVAIAGSVLRDWPDPQNFHAHRATQLDQALKALKSHSVSDVYLTLATSGLPLDGLLIVPTSDSKKVLDALKKIWPDDAVETEGAVVAGGAGARGRIGSKASGRSEFPESLSALKGSTIKLAISPSQDSRRVLREFLPVLPPEVGGGLTEPLAEGTKWMGLGINLPPKLEIHLIAQMNKAATAQSLQQAIGATLTTISKLESFKELFPKADELRALVTPKAEGDRVALSLTEKDDGAKRLMDEVAKPIMEQAFANARRSRTVTNLKFQALAMHNYLDANKTFPAAASTSKDGQKKLLSWRVMILPYLDPELYKQFHLDEPWDSAHNKTLVEKMPDVYYSSNVNPEQRRQGLTTYLVPVGEKTAFEKPTGVSIRDITDGTSNTIMIVDALPERAVIWTKPDDLAFDPAKPWTGLAIPPKGTFWAAFCDGSARRIGSLKSEQTLRLYFQMNDGEVIDE